MLLEISTSVFERICQRIATIFKIKVKMILSLYEATKHWYPVESREVQILLKYEYLIPESDWSLLVRSRNANNYTGKKIKTKMSIIIK